jgi:hypothetical protein
MADYTLTKREPCPPVIVGMVGHLRAGKDSVAAHLIKDYGFARYAFADVLKDAALHLDPIVQVEAQTAYGYGYGGGLYEYAEVVETRLTEVVGAMGWDAAKAIPEVRRTLQEYGMSIRAIDPLFWVRAAMGRLVHDTRPVVVTDVRFPNEVDAIRDKGGIIVRVTRPGANGDNHISERALNDTRADYTLNNDGTLTQLAYQIDMKLGGRIKL